MTRSLGLAFTLFLAACGGSSSAADTNTTPEAPTTCAVVLCATNTRCVEDEAGARCVPLSDESGVPCGAATCAAGQVCCNASCGICTPPDGMCTQQVCE